MESVMQWLGRARDLLDVPIISSGDTRITLWSIGYFVVLVILLFWVARLVERWFATGPLARTGLDIGARRAAGTITRYLLLLVGSLVIVQTAGINLTTFNVLAGAIGIGVGFGLQNVVSNFFAGIIIMFERPIKIGDRIEVNGVEGDVMEIGVRGTTVVTNDNIAIIVPNSSFITQNVVNWKYHGDTVRFRIPVSVAYGSDAREVERILIEVALGQPDVLKTPPPAVRLMAFGDNGLHFELRAWSMTLVHRKGQLVSHLNFAIYDAFREAGIEFPFPQRDLHLRGGTIDVRQVAGPADSRP
ncbi:MAG: mechanosensitive ion channel [Vicinamibacterales bacterium]|nr:mechanosensitive ion channel [Vicinamibacterales bacterium]